MAAEPTPRRVRLGAELRALRAASYPSGAAFARTLGWLQAKVSRFETGVQLPTDAELRVWTSATGAGDAIISELDALLDSARAERTATRRAAYARTGAAVNQITEAQLEASATRIGEYQPAFLPALVQTAAYARELLTLPGDSLTEVYGRTDDELTALIAGRMQRQNLLYEPGRQFQLIVGEAALYTRPGGTPTMRGQLDRLMAVAGLETVEFGILAFADPTPIIPLSGFGLHDDDVAFLETLSGDQRVGHPDIVKRYVRAFDTLRAHATTGEEALDLIRRATEYFHELARN